MDPLDSQKSFHNDRSYTDAIPLPSSLPLHQPDSDSLSSMIWRSPAEWRSLSEMDFGTPWESLNDPTSIRDSVVTDPFPATTVTEKQCRKIRQRHTDDEWEGHREKITHLVKENIKLEDIRRIMAKGHPPLKACRRTYQTKLQKWGLKKYTKATKMLQVLAVVDQREQEGKQTRISDENGVWPEEKIRRFRKRPFINPSDLNAMSPASLAGVEFGTPSPVASVESLGNSPIGFLNMIGALLLESIYLLDNGEQDKAKSAARNAFSQAHKHLEVRHPLTILALDLLSGSYLMQYIDKEAPICMELIKGDPPMIDILCSADLSFNDNITRKIEEKVLLKQKMLQGLLKIPEHLELMLYNLRILVVSLYTCGINGLAVLLKKRALEKRRKIFQSDDEKSFDISISLTKSFLTLCRHNDAAHLLLDLLKMSRQTDLRKALITMVLLAISLTRLDDFKLEFLLGQEAIRRLREFLVDFDLGKLKLTGGLICLLIELALVLDGKCGHYRVVQIIERVLRNFERVLGLEHVYKHHIMLIFAALLERLGGLCEAEKLQRQVFEDRTWGLDSPRDQVLTVRAMHDLMHTLKRQNKFEEAEAILAIYLNRNRPLHHERDGV